MLHTVVVRSQPFSEVYSNGTVGSSAFRRHQTFYQHAVRLLRFKRTIVYCFQLRDRGSCSGGKEDASTPPSFERVPTESGLRGSIKN